MLKVFCEIGHSDRFVIADGNFPSKSMRKNAIVLRADSYRATEMLDAVLTVFPLDTYVEHLVNLMRAIPGDTAKTPIWDRYKKIVYKHDTRGNDAFSEIENFEFYKLAIDIGVLIGRHILDYIGNNKLSSYMV